jgi:hypothetical protein
MNSLRLVARRAYSTIHPGSRPGVCIYSPKKRKKEFEFLILFSLSLF